MVTTPLGIDRKNKSDRQDFTTNNFPFVLSRTSNTSLHRSNQVTTMLPTRWDLASSRSVAKS
ncbi:hypothetical protein PIB30_098121, partial [Stylosanthes scabra]|nr:hypothetical protein [Stylosanthes scabra]